LNDCLQTGPSLLNDLTAILLRFRLHRVALTGDIEKAFLNVRLDEKDRDFTKFLWLSDPSDPESQFNVYRFKSVLFGAVSSPFILNAVVKTHLESKASIPTSSDLQRNIYVDNVVSGVDNNAEAVTYYNEANTLMKSCGFNLRAWSSNSHEVCTLADKANTLNRDTNVNVLGIRWKVDSDELCYPTRVNDRLYDNPVTKRTIVQDTASLYDPLGYLSPIHIKAKLLIQLLWKQKLGWDDKLSDDMTQKWEEISNDIMEAANTKFKRRYFNSDSKIKECELHVFGDASNKAYGAAVYLRHNNETSLVMAKSRVAPLKPEITLPRYQTTSIRIGCIEGHDLVTRGVTARHFAEHSNLWWSGPPWLKKGDWPVCELFDSAVNHVPITDIEPIAPITDITQVHGESEQFSNAKNPTVELGEIPPTGIQYIINADNVSSLNKLLRISAYVLRFISNMKRDKERNIDPLTAHEIQQAERMWVRDIQREQFQAEIRSIQRKHGKLGHLTKQLKLFVDDESILRCGGRLHNAPLDFITKFPVLLPTGHRFTELVITNAHAQVLHSGLQATITHIRQRFWIARIRQVVKALLRKCVTCIKVSGSHYRPPVSAPLQSCRVNSTPPFTVTGVDFTGALYVRSSQNTKETKAYVCLFTCAVTRAIHLELVPNLSTKSFLYAFCRFAARRSIPSIMISDNASTYLSASNEIRKLFYSPEVKTYLANNRIQWRFIPKRAPWFGGFWERLIGLTKTAIKKVLGRSFVTYDELNTILVEIESVLNERPLTYVSSDKEDPTPLTPSHLLHGRSLTCVPYRIIDDDEFGDPTFGNQMDIEKRHAHLSKLLEHF
ncbi:uncharacterized protein LOC102803656, partial [Saccoglossus kowalevskii]|uniref:Uncharacterized protein LOC102803656 n=1 Tax=Saccoglossus kowalevskii TaxID=10224 RepID=A0ABM0MG58_SACKO